MSYIIQLYPKQPNYIKWVWRVILFIAMAVIMASCSTTSKTKSVTRSSVDSSSVTRVDSNVVRSSDSINVKKDNSITTIEKEDNYTKETVIEFDTTRLSNWLKNLGPGVTKEFIDSMANAEQPLRSGWITAGDYFAADLNRVKKITIRETGVKKERTNTILNKVDSTSNSKKETVELTKSVNTDLHKTTTVKNKQVERRSYWAWLWFLIIPAVWIGGWWLGLWPLIPKRKKKDEYPVKYTGYQPPKPPLS